MSKRFSSNSIPASARLVSLKDASNSLKAQHGRGFSLDTLRRWIRAGVWISGEHYRQVGGQYKVYLPAVQQWAVSDKSIANPSPLE